MTKEIEDTGKWSKIPEYMRPGLSRYLAYGIRPGSFLTAVLCNDLRSACFQADDNNKHLLYEYISVLREYAPADSWGSLVNYSNWIKRGGILGKAKEDVAA